MLLKQEIKEKVLFNSYKVNIAYTDRMMAARYPWGGLGRIMIAERYLRHARKVLSSDKKYIYFNNSNKPWDKYIVIRPEWYPSRRKYQYKRLSRLRRFFKFARKKMAYTSRPWPENTNYERLVVTTKFWMYKYKFNRTLKHMRYTHKYIKSSFPRVYISDFITMFEGSAKSLITRLFSYRIRGKLFIDKLVYGGIMLNHKQYVSKRFVFKKFPITFSMKNLQSGFIVNKITIEKGRRRYGAIWKTLYPCV